MHGGAGCEPAADWPSACRCLHTALGRRVDNPPQDAILPYKSLLPNTPPIRLSTPARRRSWFSRGGPNQTLDVVRRDSRICHSKLFLRAYSGISILLFSDAIFPSASCTTTR